MPYPSYVHSVVANSDDTAWPVQGQGVNECGCTVAANALNLLDTRPGRALKAFGAGALLAPGAPRSYLPVAVLLAPYDLREMTMLGDAGANALGALLGLNSVDRLTGRGRWIAIGGLAGLTVLGEHLSLGAVIERTPGLAQLDRLGRRA